MKQKLKKEEAAEVEEVEAMEEEEVGDMEAEVEAEAVVEVEVEGQEGMEPEGMMRMSPLNCHPVLTSNFGGPHGDGFSDETMVKSGQKVLSINLRVGERVDAVILTVGATLFHGGGGGDLKTPLALAESEYITSMEAHSGKHKGHTRIKYIKFTTNKGNFIEGGTRTDNIGTDTAKEGYQLSGFVGRDGDELDMVGAIWTSIQAVV
ncbi:LOW QUALITY PROTEIN: Hypothetical protein PHPALM_12239 [Phytophthora palmivora]|uniref:Jacalin-type lectin domain-containing protein n=1 Tax=Phytophthora palmivora TaxID=4796 RepID=A0A2P4Y087_9STRA|nr:LOW QUALITY PROTEIN: Hypothetical protein PHPALM_12239 [Phytophthora palmivora]